MNPGPKILPFCLYMLSSGQKSRVCGSPETRIGKHQPEKISLSVPQARAGNQPVKSTLRVQPYRRGLVERLSSLSGRDSVVIIVCDYI